MPAPVLAPGGTSSKKSAGRKSAGRPRDKAGIWISCQLTSKQHTMHDRFAFVNLVV
jgi:hypothetical protein